MNPHVIDLVQKGHIPFELLLEPPYRNKKIGNVLPPLPMNSWPIQELEISARSKNCLLRNSIAFLSELTEFTFRELADIRFFGSGSFDEVISEYISKIGVDFAPSEIRDLHARKSNSREEYSGESNIDLALDYIMQNIGRREASIIRNTLSNDRMKIADLSEVWGISRQRSYQIIDKLQEDLNNLDFFCSLANSSLASWEIATIGEVFDSNPLLILGRADGEFSISIFDLLLYSRQLSIVQNFLVVQPHLATMNLSELLIYSQEKISSVKDAVSPQVSQLSKEFVSKSIQNEVQSGAVIDVMREAEEWANNLN